MRHEFKTLESKMLLDAPILAVRRDLVSMPDGFQAHREVVEHLGAVAVVAVDQEGNVALIEQYRHSVGRRLWELPAGLLDMKGEDELVCAKRELQEEAGLAAAQWSVLADLVTSPGFCEEAVRVYLAQEISEAERTIVLGDEESDLGFSWVPLDTAVDRILAGEIVNSIAVAGILAAWQVLRAGRTPRATDAPFDLRPHRMAGRRLGPDLKKL